MLVLHDVDVRVATPSNSVSPRSCSEGLLNASNRAAIRFIRCLRVVRGLVLVPRYIGCSYLWGLKMSSDGSPKPCPEDLLFASNCVYVRFFGMPSEWSQRSYFVLQLEAYVCGDSKCLRIVIRSPAPRTYRLPQYEIIEGIYCPLWFLEA
ncbi:hypothetical protein C5167_032088 [Papaver somniferum]|uniref:Uncharacterized protein n=1 Tax=Papaver somniferum TaxID=3469 RepID=A0A4Y7K9J1_PAPSO|nr:hypothetical protein C5167_032088 [Papaver somniferum]